MKKVDYAYIAGLFDGEGCIYIGKFWHKRDEYWQYVLRVKIALREKWIPEWLFFSFNCGRLNKTKQTKTPGATIWDWTVEGNKATEFLRIILPYLKLKRAQAELAFQFQKNRVKGKHTTDEQKAIMEAQRILMKELKHIGKDVV